jgi:PAS domain S-box-containing protein
MAYTNQDNDIINPTFLQYIAGRGVVLFDADLTLLETRGDFGVPRAANTLLDLPALRDHHEQVLPLAKAALNGKESQYRLEVPNALLHFLPLAPGKAILTLRDRQNRDAPQQIDRLRGLFEHSQDAVFFIALDGTILDVNHQAAVMLGYSREEQIGLSASTNIINEETPQSEEIRQRLFVGETQPIYKRTFRRKDGSTFPAEINVALIYDEAGHPSHFQSIVRDISDRQQLADELADRINQLEQLRMVDEELNEWLDVDHISDLALDSAMRITAADAGFIALQKDAGETIKLVRVLGDFQQLDQAALLKEPSIIARVLRTREPALVADVSTDPDYYCLRDKTQAKIVVPLIAHDVVLGVLSLEFNKPIKDTAQRFKTVQLLASRIANALENAGLHHHTEQQLEQLQVLYTRVSNLEQIKTDMIRIAAHDLRNPLAAIMGYTEILAEENTNGTVDEALITTVTQQLQQASGRMYGMINDILSLERIEQSASPAGYPVIDLQPIVETAYLENKQLGQGINRTLTADFPDQPVQINGDEAELREVLNNLIENAFKYTPEGGKIHLTLTTDNGQAEVRVIDDGFGVPDEQKERLFEAFSRVHSPETREISGTGLGLHLVKKIIERQDGTIIFESTYQVGSTFGFRLPLAEV